MGKSLNEYPDCPICDSREVRLITSSVRFGHKANVLSCARCSVEFLDQSSFQLPKDFYESAYHQTYITHVEPDAFDPEAYYKKMIKTAKIWADKFSALLTGSETVLDIGCSTGHFIDLIKDKAVRVCGYDLNKKEIIFCRDVLKLDVSDEPPLERFEKNTFDYITMMFVLEHIADPVSCLKDIKKLLKPGGKLVILVPSAQDALVNLYDIPEFKRFYYCIEHLYYYNQNNIGLLFNKAGLAGDIEVIQEYPITNHLNWGYCRSPSDTLSSRNGVPAIPLVDGAPIDEWTALWRRFDQLYQDFLLNRGYGDRLWCVVGDPYVKS